MRRLLAKQKWGSRALASSRASSDPPASSSSSSSTSQYESLEWLAVVRALRRNAEQLGQLHAKLDTIQSMLLDSNGSMVRGLTKADAASAARVEQLVAKATGKAHEEANGIKATLLDVRSRVEAMQSLVEQQTTTGDKHDGQLQQLHQTVAQMQQWMDVRYTHEIQQRQARAERIKRRLFISGLNMLSLTMVATTVWTWW